MSSLAPRRTGYAECLACGAVRGVRLPLRESAHRTSCGTPAATALSSLREAPAIPQRMQGHPTQGQPKRIPPQQQQAQGQAAGFQEKLHPRKAKGRVGGGEFAQKGEGAGGQPSERVRKLQQRLKALGYNLAVDGVWGRETSGALRKFQGQHGLPESGVMDDLTNHEMSLAGSGTGKGGPPAPPSRIHGPSDGKAHLLKFEDGQRVLTLPDGKTVKIEGEDPLTGEVSHGDARLVRDEAGHLGAVTKDGTYYPLGGATPDPNAATGSATGSTGTGSTGTKKRSRHKAGSGTPGGASHASGGSSGGPSAGTGYSGARSGGATGATAAQTPGISANGTLSQGAGMSGAPNKAVRTFQALLDEAGYDLGDAGVDGRFGPDTEQAVKAFEQAWDLPLTGKVDARVLAVLNRVVTTRKAVRKAGQPASTAIDAMRVKEGFFQERLHPRRRDGRFEIKVGSETGASRPGEMTHLSAPMDVGAAPMKPVERYTDPIDLPPKPKKKKRQRYSEPIKLSEATIGRFDPGRHPRNRMGEFRKVLAGLAPGEGVAVRGGLIVGRKPDGTGFRVFETTHMGNLGNRDAEGYPLAPQAFQPARTRDFHSDTAAALVALPPYTVGGRPRQRSVRGFDHPVDTTGVQVPGSENETSRELEARIRRMIDSGIPNYDPTVMALQTRMMKTALNDAHARLDRAKRHGRLRETYEWTRKRAG